MDSMEIAKSIAAKTRFNHLWPDYSGGVLVDDLVEDLACKLERDTFCADHQMHRGNCDYSSLHPTKYVPFDRAEWTRVAKGES